MVGAILNKKPARSAGTYAVWAFLVASPFLLMGALSLAIGHNVLAGLPTWTDELDYWRAVFSWLHVGPAAGYSGIGELHAPVGSLGVHGLTPILLYAGPAMLLGWSYSSIVLFNGLWISLGALTFCLLVKPKASVAAAIGLSLMIYAPVVLYVSTSMTELANYGLLLFYLAFITRLTVVRRRAAAQGKPFAGAVWALLAALTLLVCMLYRITYAGLLIPLVLAACDFRFSVKTLVGFVLAALFSVGVYFLSSRLTSPFPSGFLYNFLRTGSLGLSVKMFLSHAKANLIDYFLRPSNNLMESLQRILYCAAMGLTLVGSFLGFVRENSRLRLRVRVSGASLLACLMLLIPFSLVVCFYETNDWSDYRTLAPFLWLVFAAAAVRGQRILPATFLAASALTLAVLLVIPPVGVFGDTYRYKEPVISQERRAVLSAVTYDPGAADPFENTVRTDVFDLPTVALLDPGMGIQTGFFTADTVIRSHWVVTDYFKVALEGYEPVLKNEAGRTYRLMAVPAESTK